MFGTNPIRDNEILSDGLTLAVQDIFYTIQGEGPFSGEPAVFIRLAGCNLACVFCDTDFESKIDNRMTIEQIVAQVAEMPHPELVVLTGGEPLRQRLDPLLEALLRTNRVDTVQIETAGTLWQPKITHHTLSRGGCDAYVVVVCSPKTPKVAPWIAANCTHFKYIIEAGRQGPDGLPAFGSQPSNSMLAQTLFRPPASAQTTIWVSPCDVGVDHAFSGLSNNELNKMNVAAAVDAAMTHGYRLSLQTHKLLGLP